ncbi:PsiF family protein [Azoarcus sp. L1K30]|uniref:PsiF family protein n=1 Tax=Azoarcus sp. L1K30 TaxID=2820277 RepID=UPI0032C22A88
MRNDVQNQFCGPSRADLFAQMLTLAYSRWEDEGAFSLFSKRSYMMKGMIMSALAGVLLATLSPADAWANPQHERMKRCNQEAREQSLKGDARK